MAVSESINLPSQPGVGSVSYLPLGGDGYTAPFAAYQIIQWEITGDASGGAVVFGASMDMRYTSLVGFVNSHVQQQTAADADFRFHLSGDTFAEQAFSGTATKISGTIAGATVQKQWNPTPFIMPGGVPGSSLPRIAARWLNVDGDVFELNALIYLFNIRVREVTPMGPLLWARGAT